MNISVAAGENRVEPVTWPGITLSGIIPYQSLFHLGSERSNFWVPGALAQCHVMLSDYHGCSCALSSVPTHAILDMAIFLGSDDLLHEWTDRLVCHMTFNNILDILMAIAQFTNPMNASSSNDMSDGKCYFCGDFPYFSEESI